MGTALLRDSDPKSAPDLRSQNAATPPCALQVFKFKDSTSSGQVKADVYISFGGLLMQLTGDPRRLEDIDVDQNIYLLIRKI